jgi:hypothetical protein
MIYFHAEECFRFPINQYSNFTELFLLFLFIQALNNEENEINAIIVDAII